MAKELMKLRIEENENGGNQIWLDEKRLHHIREYEIKSLPNGRMTELFIKMLVQFPTNQGRI